MTARAIGRAAPPREDLELEAKIKSQRSSALADITLTLPVFAAYHLGVAFSAVRNAADPVSMRLASVAHADLVTYAGLTVLLGSLAAGALWLLGARGAANAARLGWLLVEAALYALLMKVAASMAASNVPLGASGDRSVGGAIVLSLGAGFYEELVFRVGLFGGGALLLRRYLGAGAISWPSVFGWAVVCAIAFSGWHYVGGFGDPFTMRSFVFRAVCGACLTLVFVLRGFGPTVWTHTLYDLAVFLA